MTQIRKILLRMKTGRNRLHTVTLSAHCRAGREDVRHQRLLTGSSS